MSLQDQFARLLQDDLRAIVATNIGVSYKEVTRWLTAGVPSKYGIRMQRVLNLVKSPCQFIVEDLHYGAVRLRPFLLGVHSTEGAICVTRTMYLPEAIAWVRHHLAVPGETDPVEIQLLF